MGDVEVGHANVLCKAFVTESDHFLPGVDQREPIRSMCRVEQEKVDVVELHELQALFQRRVGSTDGAIWQHVWGVWRMAVVLVCDKDV